MAELSEIQQLFGGDLQPGKILGTTKEGRPIVVNSEGGLSTELSITVEDPRKPNTFINIPSIFNGKIVDQNEAIRTIIGAGFIDPETGNKIESFDSLEIAESAAQKRTQSLDNDPNIQRAFKLLGQR